MELQGLIIYTGEYQFKSFSNPKGDDGKLKYTAPQFRKLKVDEAKRVWNLRSKKEKDAVYRIPRPSPYTPVPEETLRKLNEVYKCSELELKLYYLCCIYQDEIVYRGIRNKPISYELLRDTLKKKDTGSRTDHEIYNALCFLKVLGLIDFEDTTTSNRKNAQIDSFRFLKAEKYITRKKIEISPSELMSKEDIENLYARVPDFQDIIPITFES